MEKEVKAVKDHDKYGKSLVQLSRILMGVGIIASFFASFWKQRDTESF